jgi:hypothetical protein
MIRPQVHIVDDDPDIRDGLAWLFESRGFSHPRRGTVARLSCRPCAHARRRIGVMP